MSAQQQQPEENGDRMVAARAKAEAARMAAERRRSMNSDARERSNSPDIHDTPTPLRGATQERSSSVDLANGGIEALHGDSGEHRRNSSALKRRSSTPKKGMRGGSRRGSGVAAAGFSNASHSGTKKAAHPQTPEEYAAAIEEMRQEYERITMKDEELEERLQLYSDVVGLRKELVIVQEDEARLRQQLAATEAVIASSDPTVEKMVSIYEEEAQQSALQKLWMEESECHNPDTMEWAEIDVNNLRERVDEAHKKFTAAAEKADSLYLQQEEAINKTTDARERERATIAENHEREMEGLSEARIHARQVATEQHFHRHRGTAQAPPVVLTKDKERTTRQRRVDEVEFRTTAQVGKMKDELTELMEQVKMLKRHLDDSRQVTEEKRREYEASLKVVEAEGSEAREMKEGLLKEEEELKELKADLQAVLHYVRAKNREEEGW
ncbi:protein of unknown function - conserved [Leishmania donovani]|uniref:Hypothetical_protein_conserved n=1 Tax=Leishmania donovani TaxID=5661 RepID=A0A504XH80_LEIDO|nr:hypothetical protein CGC21_2390 [Leishmania donovani]CAJ1988772.1 protein of unknown function - conserved [Leishmania donovani]VDZ44652.1 hypothetical_protein_conserved [Leishmania donovani]